LGDGTHSIGVDLERCRAGFPTADIACRYFAPAEVRRYLAIPDDHSRVTAFYRCWTRKEAVLKAMGAGLSVDLVAFEVSFDDPVAPPALIWSAPEIGPPTDTELVDLTPLIARRLPGHLATLAVVPRQEGTLP